MASVTNRCRGNGATQLLQQSINLWQFSSWSFQGNVDCNSNLKRPARFFLQHLSSLFHTQEMFPVTPTLAMLCWWRSVRFVCWSKWDCVGKWFWGTVFKPQRNILSRQGSSQRKIGQNCVYQISSSFQSSHNWKGITVCHSRVPPKILWCHVH